MKEINKNKKHLSKNDKKKLSLMKVNMYRIVRRILKSR